MKNKTIALAAAAALSAMLIFSGCDSGASTASESAAPAASQTTSSEASAAAQDASADAVAAATAAVSEGDSAFELDLATPNPQFETLRITGPISSRDDASDITYITDEQAADGSGAVSEVGAVEGEDCIIVDVQTGQEVDDDTLQIGQRVTAYVGLNMTRSIPPQAPCYALMTNLPADGMGAAHYIHALQVSPAEQGGIAVLNQNADTIVTIPADLPIEIFGETETTTAASIVPGTRLIAWYDMETRSMPAQATATRVMVDIDD